MRPGDYWYRMLDPEGDPRGFVRLRVEHNEDAALSFDWELRIVHDGSPYEEERTMALDASGRLLAAGHFAGGTRVSARRAGERMRGEKRVGDAAPEPLDVAVADDAVTGLGFLLAGSLDLEAGASLARTEVDEAAGFQPEGPILFTVVGEEPLGEEEAWKVVLTREGGRETPIWVDAQRRIVQVDWGGGNLMALSAEPTRHLFQPPPPAVEQLDEQERGQLVLAGTFPGFTPRSMFAHWTSADRITRWWPQKALVDAHVGGRFHMIWEEPPWYLRGEITELEPDERLAFTWKWDHAPASPTLQVRVELEAVEGGTRLRITQGPYDGSGAQEEERRGHLRGWQHVCARLRGLCG